MFGLFGSRKKQIVGCDIGSSTIKIVELACKKGEYELVHATTAPLSSETIVDGAIMDSSLVVETLQSLISENGIKNDNFGTAVSGHSVIIKKIQLPSMSPEELAESIQWEAEQYIPFDISDVELDYEILDMGSGDTMDVLLVAVKKEKVADYTAVIRQAGKQPKLVDIDVFALQNAFEVNYGAEEQTAGLVNIGASVMNINVVHQGQTIFWRDVSFGGNQFTEAIQREFNLTRDDAEKVKQGEAIGSLTLQQAMGAINGVSEDLAAELQKTIDFFVATSQVDGLDKIVLSGGSSQVVGLEAVLKERFQVPVEILNPFRNIRYNESSFDPEWISRNAPSLAVAVGLAVRAVGE